LLIRGFPIIKSIYLSQSLFDMSFLRILALPLVSCLFALVESSPAMARGCPDGFLSIQGGYCRDISCVDSSYAKSDPSALKAMKAEGAYCDKGFSARWGDNIVKKSFRGMLGF